MRHLFDCWHQVAERVRAAGTVAVFLDFDGTLVPFRQRPEDVRLSHATRNALARLAANPKCHVRIISGRRRSDVQTLTSLTRVEYMGLHGWENGRPSLVDAETKKLLERTRIVVTRKVAGLPGIRVEDKGAVFSVHYRGAEEGPILAARAAVAASLAGVSALRAIPGRKVWEILPWHIGDKGTAVTHQLHRLTGEVVPIYAGDDRTDELAFAALPQGITIRVGRRALTRARYQLRDPGEVRSFLEKLSSILT